jgi:hypothetical protein
MDIAPDHRIRQDLLSRLRWSILGGLDNIEIAFGPHDQPTWLPFFGHSSANESLSEPPLSHVEAYSQDCASRRDMDIGAPEEYRYKMPANLSINNLDGRPITLGQFVTEVHAYLNRVEIIEDIKKIKGAFRGHTVTRKDGSRGKEIVYGRPPRLPEDIEIFLAWVMVWEVEGTVTFRISLFLEGELPLDAERFWANRLRKAYVYEQERQA